MTHGLWTEVAEAGYSNMQASWLLREKPPPHQLAPKETEWLYPLFRILHLLRRRRRRKRGLVSPGKKGTVEKAKKQAGHIHEVEAWARAGGRN